ncbi:MAG TPA: hypothetical protein PKD83_09835 [Ignavibacteria bacterium]|nr:hypothetical protein [Ignavibacteria bacterium]
MQSININIKTLFFAAIPSVFVIIISVFFDNIYQNSISGIASNKEVVAMNLWYYPILIYLLFIALLFWTMKVVKEKLNEGKSSEKELVKTIEKWSGLVDGIGTALPLIGAAVILFTIGLGKENQKLFLELAVPFEIKSLFILASAKLFESVFDEFEIQIQEIYDRNKGTSQEPQFLKDTIIEFKNMPDQHTLDEMNKTIAAWKETTENMKDPQFVKTLETLLKITGRS